MSNNVGVDTKRSWQCGGCHHRPHGVNCRVWTVSQADHVNGGEEDRNSKPDAPPFAKTPKLPDGKPGFRWQNVRGRAVKCWPLSNVVKTLLFVLLLLPLSPSLRLERYSRLLRRLQVRRLPERALVCVVVQLESCLSGCPSSSSTMVPTTALLFVFSYTTVRFKT